ncbi:hypothetical protein CROQUDRAFT_660861 [Cronartium quercuum f. sp. fusiforme G11]|uniref:mannan endo-1,4-beta-mannosidase n=1 Tax=Cronartium quercuum f. sp. fusiforme G11 TaxID=708437 RepID=A0A9P6T9N3_9BASI|nr:hypothetical protein CROQUDRAFT_660861 [Cronartium quercuum f. sp. fusiforme G11]
MSFFKKASEKFKQVQTEATEKFKQQHSNLAPILPSRPKKSPPPIPSRPGTGSACNQGKYIIRNPNTGQLEVEGTGEIIRFASLCAPELFDNEGFEKEDTMRTISGFGKWPVTRTYTLKIKSFRINRGHINGWDSQLQDFIYDEDMFKSIDHTIAMATRYNVRLIIPIINQDFGSEDTNWVGNFTDLIRHRKGLSSWEDAKDVDWWTDRECMDSMKKILNYLLNRINSVTGVRIGDDPTILAFETGNEMNKGGLRPAPAAWTIEVATHIKSLAPRILVMDGSFARTDAIEWSHEKEVLASDVVDIMSWHYYGYGEKRRVQMDVQVARQSGKVFICGEYGFFSHAAEFGKFLEHCDSQGASGTLAWSLRPHSIKGGFKTHGEGNGIWSYHVPGWKPVHNVEEPEWDHRERDVIDAIRKAAFKLTNDRIVTPDLIEPSLFLLDQGQCFSWRGSAWADTYEIWVNSQGGGEDGWELCERGVTDNVKEGRLKYDCQNIYSRVCGCGTDGIYIKMRGMTTEKKPGPFSNVFRI